MNKEMQIIREVNIQAEAFYSEAVSLGDHAAHALKENHRSQLTNLENIAESAFKTTDILDYVKKQTARYAHWRHRLSDGDMGLGERLKNYLEQDLLRRKDAICNRLKIDEKTEENKQLRRHIYLLLMRQFIRQMIVQYEYSASLEKYVGQREKGGGRR